MTMTSPPPPTRRFRVAPLLAAVLPFAAVAGCAFLEGFPGADLAPFVSRKPAGIVPPPTVGYRAIQLIELDDQTYTTRVYAMPGVKRLEMPTESQNIISVVRYDDDGETVSWIEGTSIVNRMAVGHVGIDLRSPNYITFELAPIGPDTAEGVAATRYAYRATALDGGRSEGEVWLTPENIVVRLEGTLIRPDADEARRVMMRLQDLQLGPQDPALFEPPGTPVDLAPGLFEEFGAGPPLRTPPLSGA